MCGPARPLLAQVVIACALLFPAAAAQAQPAPVTLAPAAERLAATIAARWQTRQESDGSFRDDVRVMDPLPWRDAYGSGMLGAALLLHGARTGDRRSIHAGLLGLRNALSGPLKPDQRQVFQTLAFGTAYDVGMSRLGRNPEFRRLRPKLEATLRRLAFHAIGSGRSYYNYYLVEAVGTLAITRHPIRSARRGAMLADPGGAHQRARRLIAYQLPGYTLSGTTEYDDVRLALISDPPGNPPAYHAFSIGLLGRAIALLGDRGITGETRKLLERAGRASWALMTPDGDVSWSGRSQEQSWTLAMTASGLTAASALRRASGTARAQLRSTALRGLERLERIYASQRFGLAITPSIVGGLTEGALAGMDRYVSMSSYTGLTLMGLEWLLAQPASQEPFVPARTGADRNGAFRLARSREFAVVRSDDVWYSIGRDPEHAPKVGSDHSHDLRYDAGLNALRVREADGTWTSVVPPRPFTDDRRDVDTAGPTLALGGPALRPEGRRPLQVDPRHGRVVLTVDLRRHSGEVVRPDVEYRYRPVGCGVALEVPSSPGAWWYSVFFRGVPRRDGDAVTDGEQRVSVDAPFETEALGLYHSGMDARLRRVRLLITPNQGRFTVTFCREGRPVRP